MEEKEVIHLVEKALYLALTAHMGQKDKQGEPYILHCIGVLVALGSEATELEQAVALCHDIVEDTGFTKEEVAEAVSPEVAEIVGILTRREGETYEHYIDRVATHPIATNVKIADLRHNLRGGKKFPSLHQRYERALTRLLRY